MTTLELLSPARNAEIAIEAIRHGADAVYIGAPSHGARSAAGNSTADIARVCDYAHQFGARVYVTVNTIVYDSELADVERMIGRLYRAGVDALIVQDLGLLRLDIPPIALHASTQCDIRTPDKARFLASLGFSQLVLARELTLRETKAIHEAVPDTPLEAFVHGALCVSFSGDCQAGHALTGRSANRGECPQICRLPYDLIDGSGNKIVEGRHLLSMRDLNRSLMLEAMIDAGVQSFKIEGRLKDAGYVKNVTADYRRRLDAIIAANPDRLQRSSRGKTTTTFIPDVSESFNRGFTQYFTATRRPEGHLASLQSPKWCGKPVATVERCDGARMKINGHIELANGDGLGYFDTNGRFCGFRVNRAEGHTLHLATPVDIPRGTQLLRNSNKRWTDLLAGNTATRRISTALTLRTTSRGIALDAADERGARATVALDIECETANTPQAERRRQTLTKTGDTIHTIDSLTDTAGNIFIPASRLTALRRDVLAALDRAWSVMRPVDRRHAEDPSAGAPATLTYHDNVANHLARKVYTDHGTTAIEPALEVSGANGRRRVMQTRYCLRRELGHCLRTPQGKELRGPLTLTSGPTTRLEVEFDCEKCIMNIYCCTSQS